MGLQVAGFRNPAAEMMVGIKYRVLLTNQFFQGVAVSVERYIKNRYVRVTDFLDLSK